MEVSFVPYEVVDFAWPAAEGFFKTALKSSSGRFTTAEIRQGIEDGKMALWVALEDEKVVAALTTRVVEYASGRAMVIDWIGGEHHRMDEWFSKALNAFKGLARDNGCTHIESTGRIGWKKILLENGWRVESFNYRMDIEDEQGRIN
jgi:hypothetical protein